MSNLAVKYRPKTFEDVTEQSMVVEILKNMCNSSDLPNRNFLLIGPAGTGKAQPMYSKVLTPYGYIQMKDVEVGTEVYTANGNLGRVTEIFPQGVRPIYEIVLNDNTKIRVSDEHLNVVYQYVDDKRVDHCITTKELLTLYETSTDSICIDCPSVPYNETDLISDPYLVGVLFGTGHSFNDLPKESDNKVFEILKKEWKPDILNTTDDNPPVFCTRETYQGILQSLEILWKQMYRGLPVEYLQSGIDQRREFYYGLRDRSFPERTNHITYITTNNPKYSNDISSLVRSIGMMDTVTSYEDNDMLYYKHEIDETPGLLSRYITSINLIGEEECQCILIDHEDHTYISDGFIPTHNTTTARILANVLNENKGEPIEIDAASHSGVDSMREIVQQAQTYPVGLNWKVFIIDECHALSNAAWQSALKCLEESPAKSIFCLCTTNPEKIPATILSRVQTFQLSKISLDGIIARLKHVIECENKEGRGITYTDDAISFIAKLANGGMRDALTLLDKALAYGNDITSESLQLSLNLPNYNDYFALLNACAKKDNKLIAEIIHKVYNSGVNFVKWFEGFHSFVINVVKYIFLQDINATMIPSYYADKISNYGTAHSVVCLKLANKLLEMNHELKSTQYLQEVALTYLCTVSKGGKQ